MNREKLEILRKSVAALPWDAPLVALTLTDLLAALLEGAPDVGPEAQIDALREQGYRHSERLLALEAANAGAMRQIHALQAGVPDVEPSAYARIEKLESQMRERALTWDLNRFGQDMTQLDQALLAHSDRLTVLEVKMGAAQNALHVDSQCIGDLQAYRAAHEALSLTVHGSLKALEGAMDARVAEADAGAARRTRVEALRARFPAGRVTLFGELLDALLGRPDVGLSPDTRDEAFRAKMRSGQAWTTESPDVIAQAMGLIVRARSRLLGDGTTVISDARILLHEALDLLHPGMSRPVTRGATPCPVCQSIICKGDVDARGCDTRAATRKAIQP